LATVPILLPMEVRFPQGGAHTSTSKHDRALWSSLVTLGSSHQCMRRPRKERHLAWVPMRSGAGGAREAQEPLHGPAVMPVQRPSRYSHKDKATRAQVPRG
jgi:hypothetical protein